MHVYTFLTLDPLSPPSWSLSLRPQTKTLVLMVAADSSPDNLFRVRLQKRSKNRNSMTYQIMFSSILNHLYHTPSSHCLLILLFLIVRCQERHSSQIFILCTNATHNAQTMDLTVNPWAPALFYGNLDVPVILNTQIQECSAFLKKQPWRTDVCEEIQTNICAVIE